MLVRPNECRLQPILASFCRQPSWISPLWTTLSKMWLAISSSCLMRTKSWSRSARRPTSTTIRIRSSSKTRAHHPLCQPWSTQIQPQMPHSSSKHWCSPSWPMLLPSVKVLFHPAVASEATKWWRCWKKACRRNSSTRSSNSRHPKLNQKLKKTDPSLSHLLPNSSRRKCMHTAKSTCQGSSVSNLKSNLLAKGMLKKWPK